MKPKINTIEITRYIHHEAEIDPVTGEIIKPAWDEPVYEQVTREMNDEEYAEYQRQQAEEEARKQAEFWAMSYADRVSYLIRQRYSLDDELALSRQRETKATEFAEYFAYCEECKKNAQGGTV